jgi:hypothetical protein
MNREQRLAETFVELADTLIDDFDVIDFLQVLAARRVELLEVAASSLRYTVANLSWRQSKSSARSHALSASHRAPAPANCDCNTEISAAAKPSSLTNEKTRRSRSRSTGSEQVRVG